ncbi:MAG: ATP-binding protein [Jaaginema sp. PMC 1079.18]|nr:ATP-binding protein [Jaaginema sp. PMC 1080.18]MEC4851762.1 ATP-binding protein [Jaaginema sp. PMC 1079.18]MEC4867241.1 ATP-binding protein [Jaaginema sp. PMC 1078.18]
MSSSNLTSQWFQQQAASLLLYQSVFQHNIGQSFLNVLQTLDADDSLSSLRAYGLWFKALATTGQSWQDYVIACILHDDNPFTQQVQRQGLNCLPEALIAAAKHDLQVLQQLSRCGGQQLAAWLPGHPVPWTIPTQHSTVLHHQESWSNAIALLADYYRQKGTGIFARYQALRWQNQELVGIDRPDPIKISEIVGYETQKASLIKNTEFLLSGYRALHILLYGSRGSGKSSLVKSLLHEGCDRGLRLIEVAKAQLVNLPLIVDQLRDVPQKFIIFVDDLSFEEDDEAFKALKVVLEGSVTAKAQNVVVYATSNRRHLVREFFSDRPRPKDSDEIQAWDTQQEKLSFSDRFGLTLTFEPADQSTYLQIVHHLADQAQIPLNREDLDFRAKQWATRHNKRSGRTARQFIDFLAADLATNS